MSTTPLIILTIFIALGIYDFAVVYFGNGIQSSVSKCLQYAGFKSPMFVFALGCVIGHIFLVWHQTAFALFLIDIKIPRKLL